MNFNLITLIVDLNTKLNLISINLRRINFKSAKDNNDFSDRTK